MLYEGRPSESPSSSWWTGYALTGWHTVWGSVLGHQVQITWVPLVTRSHESLLRVLKNLFRYKIRIEILIDTKCCRWSAAFIQSSVQAWRVSHLLCFNDPREHGSKRRARPSPEVYKLSCSWAWRHDSEVKSTGSSSRGPEFSFQQPHGGSQPSIMRSGAILRAGVRGGRMLYT